MRTLPRVMERGQALIMVTLALMSMVGLMGLAVDLGWSFFVRKAAQSAADAAALAAVNKAMASFGGGSVNCPSANCQILSSPTSCGTGLSGNLYSACQYAQSNGFSAGGDSGRQDVLVSADVTSPPPTAPGVTAMYWVNVKITNTIPQLFSAVLGNGQALVSAQATAGIVQAIVQGSVILINREKDAVSSSSDLDGKPGCDHCNVFIGGGGGGGSAGTNLNGPDGIFLASANTPVLQGSGTVKGNTATRGAYTEPGGWTGSWQNNQPDGTNYYDPLRGKGQPPLPPTALTPVPVPGGALTTSVPQCSTGVCQPGFYFATGSTPCPAGYATCATGAPIMVGSDITGFGGSSFGNFIFYGGMTTGNSTMNLGPGEYVMAGTTTGKVLSATQTTITSSATDAGEVIILTDATYPGMTTQLNQPGVAQYAPNAANLSFGQAQFWNSNVTINGLDRTQGLPSYSNNVTTTCCSLSDFAPAVMWQDQRNSSVKYKANGTLDLGSCTTINDCSNGGYVPADAGISIKNSPGNGSTFTINGLVYQPRGNWLNLDAGNVKGQNAVGRRYTQIVTGAIDMRGTASMTLLAPVTNDPLLQTVSALVQ